MIYRIFKRSGILSRGKMAGVRMGAFTAKERQTRCRMFVFQNKAYLTL